MAVAPFENAFVLTGPTGSGKSQLALTLAEHLGAEIVSMDSMALYRGMDIGTAKPTREDRRRVPHHLVDVLDPWESASVAWWLGQAAECCREIEGRGRRVLFVGGTPLYLKALLYGLFDGPPADEELRRRLTEEAERLGVPSLHARLGAVDAVSAAPVASQRPTAYYSPLEVWELTGRPLSEWQTQWAKREEAALTPSPLAGEGWGGGSEPLKPLPPTPTLPRKGGGEQYRAASPVPEPTARGSVRPH